MAATAATREVVCNGCSTLLRFPAGAQVVRCVLCSQITPTPQPDPNRPPDHQARPSTSTSHLICGGCRTVLRYPTGAESVRCAVCTTVNRTAEVQNTVANCRCDGCGTYLMYQLGATSVRCAVCQFVTPVAGPAPMLLPQEQTNHFLPPPSNPSLLPPVPGPLPAPLTVGNAPGTSGAQGQGNIHGFQRQVSNTLYVVQNPSPIGEERYNMSIGVKLDLLDLEGQPIEDLDNENNNSGGNGNDENSPLC